MAVFFIFFIDTVNSTITYPARRNTLSNARSLQDTPHTLSTIFFIFSTRSAIRYLITEFTSINTLIVITFNLAQRTATYINKTKETYKQTELNNSLAYSCFHLIHLDSQLYHHTSMTMEYRSTDHHKNVKDCHKTDLKNHKQNKNDAIEEKVREIQLIDNAYLNK